MMDNRNDINNRLPKDEKNEDGEHHHLEEKGKPEATRQESSDEATILPNRHQEDVIIHTDKEMPDSDGEEAVQWNQVASNQAEPLYTEEPGTFEQGTEKAGFWIRLCAYLIDVVVVFSLNAIFLSPVIFFQDATIFRWEYISVISIFSGIVYYMYFLFMTKGLEQTLGKMIIGIKVISSNKGKMTWGDVFFREVVGRLIYNIIFVLKFLYIIIAFTDEKKGVHDIIGNTRVVYAKS